MANKLRKLELLRVLGTDAKELSQARAKSMVTHASGDIDAAGDEVEEPVRCVIRRKLPTTYYVGEGHIVDSALTVSPQIDVVIADNSAAPILFRGEKGNEYFPYESVYAIGEVKSTYYKSKKYVEAFVACLQHIRATLCRAPTPPNYLGHGISLASPLSTGVSRRFQNPLFSFMLFVDAGDFAIEQLIPIYRETNAAELPNIVCVLNRGVVVNANIVKNNGSEALGPLNLVPELDLEIPGVNGRWVFISFGDEENRAGANFGALWFTLMHHLRSAVLSPPDMLAYLGQLMNVDRVLTFA